MGEILHIEPTGNISTSNQEKNVLALGEKLLAEVSPSLKKNASIVLPISQIATLGSGVSSLIPALNSITQTSTIATDGLYKLANQSLGDTLKIAKNGNFWGAFHTADGASKFAQLQSADSLTTTTKTAVAANPATMMMAVALFSVEKQLGTIEETQKKIVSYLEIENEAEIEADIETLTKLIQNYKHNWDNEQFIKDNHKLVLDIQRSSRKNMIAYQKKVCEALSGKHFLPSQMNVTAKSKELQKKFQYYRLSLYTFSLSSFVEIMLGGNYKEEYISSIKDEINCMSDKYRDLFTEGSIYLEKMSQSSIDTNVIRSIGTASKAVGKFIGGIPVIKEGSVDEFLLESGKHLKENAKNIEQKSVKFFSAFSNPCTGAFVDQMNDMIKIYNHTTDLCFDKENIYLLAN